MKRGLFNIKEIALGATIMLLLAIFLTFNPTLALTGLAGADTTQGAVSSCQNITGDSTLTGDVTATGTCFNITADNVELNCAGFSIFYDTAGSGSTNGVNARNVNNIVIKDCTIVDGAPGGTTNGIELELTINATIKNTTIIINSTGIGIKLTNTTSTRITNVTMSVATGGVSATFSGNTFIRNSTIKTVTGNAITISGSNEVNDTLIEKNILNVTGTTGTNNGVATSGGTCCGRNLTIHDNLISTNGASSNHGVNILSNWNEVRITNNTIMTLGDSGSNLGISITADNISIENNTIITNGGGQNEGIQASAVITGAIVNNDIKTNSTGFCCNVGVSSSGATNFLIANNTINTDGAGCCNNGVAISGNNITVQGNFIKTRGAADNWGIEISGFQGQVEKLILENQIHTTGTNDNVGIQLRRPDVNIIKNNFINATGTGVRNYGIHIRDQSGNPSVNNSIVDNFIITNSTTGHGIVVDKNSFSNTMKGNNITILGDGYGVLTLGTTSSGLFFNTRIRSKKWINITSSTALNFTNTTFITDNGSVQYIGLITLNNAEFVDDKKLNITQNRVFLNSSNLTALNKAARISLNNITNATGVEKDPDDGSGFSFCISPQCVNVSFLSNIFVFDATGFTAYRTTTANISTPVVAEAAPVVSSGGGGRRYFSNVYRAPPLKRITKPIMKFASKELARPKTSVREESPTISPPNVPSGSQPNTQNEIDSLEEVYNAPGNKLVTGNKPSPEILGDFYAEKESRVGAGLSALLALLIMTAIAGMYIGWQRSSPNRLNLFKSCKKPKVPVKSIVKTQKVEEKPEVRKTELQKIRPEVRKVEKQRNTTVTKPEPEELDKELLNELYK